MNAQLFGCPREIAVVAPEHGENEVALELLARVLEEDAALDHLHGEGLQACFERFAFVHVLSWGAADPSQIW